MKVQKTKENLLFRIRIIVASCLFFALPLLTGCGEKEELTVYRTSMEQFFEEIQAFDSSINALDPESETAVADLLALLDSMEQSFSRMAQLEVPEDFSGVEQLADEADDYMKKAVSLYHQAFEGESYDASLAENAKQYYDLSNQRIWYILSLLHGKEPDSLYTYEQPGIENTAGSNE